MLGPSQFERGRDHGFVCPPAHARETPATTPGLDTRTAGTPQNFTSDRARLLTAINRPFALALPEPTSVLADRRNQNGVMLNDPEGCESGACLCGLCVLETIARVADGARDVGGRRKSVLFIGSSVRSSESCRGRGVGSRVQRLAVCAARNRLETLARELAELPGIPDRQDAAQPWRGKPAPRFVARVVITLNAGHYLGNGGRPQPCDCAVRRLRSGYNLRLRSEAAN